MTSVAIIGPGAIGGTLAAWLAQDKTLDVTVCARTPLEDLVVETPNGVITAKPSVLTNPADAPVVDWVLVCTKTYDVEATRPWLDQLVGQGTRVAIVQNGVEHVRLFEHLVPAEQLVPVIINLPAARTAPGRMVQQRQGFIWAPSGGNGAALVALFDQTDIEAVVAEDFLSRAWIKLCGNSGAIVPALTLRATGPVWSAELEAIVRAIAEDCAAVGRAEGAVIDQQVVEETVSMARNMGEGTRSSSIHADRLAGNRMEVDARNGVIVRLGEKHGIPTPMNKLLVTLLEASGSPWVS
jgi:2-dehydropantoate 2-reductase